MPERIRWFFAFSMALACLALGVQSFLPLRAFAQSPGQQSAPYVVLGDGTSLSAPAHSPTVVAMMVCAPAIAGISQCDWRDMSIGVATAFGCQGGESAASTFYMGIGIPGSASCNLTMLSGSDQNTLPVGVLQRLSCSGSVSGGICTVFKNGSPTALSCTVGSSLNCVDTTHTVPTAHGDQVAIQVSGSSTGSYTAMVDY